MGASQDACYCSGDQSVLEGRPEISLAEWLQHGVDNQELNLGLWRFIIIIIARCECLKGRAVC